MKNPEAVCEKIFRLAKGVQCEIISETRDEALTRFADNVISQNVASRSTVFSVRLLDSGRMVKINFNQDGDSYLRDALRFGLETLKKQRRDKSLLPLAGPKTLQKGKKLYFPQTAGLTADYRAKRVAELVAACKKKFQTAFGLFENSSTELIVANSLGVFAKHRETSVIYSATVRDKDGSGWAEAADFDATKIPFEKTNETARAKASASRAPREIPPGKYTIILSPQAAAELFCYAGRHGFNGRTYNEGRSFACGRLGKKILSPLLTLEDDALDGPSPGTPFDFEGQPRSKVELIKNGVITAVVHDRRTAKTAGTLPTGHSLPQPNGIGPIPMNLSIKPGSGSLEDLIKSSERALLITQLHYINLLRPETLEMTGMTRNGTFLVENGKISFPVKNLRFTQSMANAFSEIDAVSGEAELARLWCMTSCPAVRIKNFNFSSSTKF